MNVDEEVPTFDLLLGFAKALVPPLSPLPLSPMRIMGFTILTRLAPCFVSRRARILP